MTWCWEVLKQKCITEIKYLRKIIIMIIIIIIIIIVIIMIIIMIIMIIINKDLRNKNCLI